MARPTNTQFALGVHLLTLLAQAQPGAMLDSTELAVSPATNPVHVRRVLGQLRQAGLVCSQAGAHGGWTLVQAPAQIDLAQVWLAVNGHDPLLGVHSPDPDCEIGRRIQENLLEIDRRTLDLLLDELAKTTVGDVLANSTAVTSAGA